MRWQSLSQDSKSSHLVRVVHFILDSVDDEGAWGGDDFEDWKPIITTLTVGLLFSLGFSSDSEWTISGDGEREVRLSKSLHYLDSNIKQDGSFGEDIWDATKLATIISHYGLQTYFTKNDILKKYIIAYADGKKYLKFDHTWSGPGTIAALIDFFDEIEDVQRSSILFSELIGMQMDDGSFRGPGDAASDGFVHPVWHTTQALMVAVRNYPSEQDSRIKKMVDWICHSQDRNAGCWRAFSRFDVYFTSYAIIALLKLKKPPFDVIKHAYDWLVDMISENGKIRDAGGTIMGALVLTALHNDSGQFKVTIADIRELSTAKVKFSKYKREVEELTSRVTQLEREVSSYEKKFGNADVVLSKKDIFYITLIIGVIGIALTVIFQFGTEIKGFINQF